MRLTRAAGARRSFAPIVLLLLCSCASDPNTNTSQLDDAISLVGSALDVANAAAALANRGGSAPALRAAANTKLAVPTGDSQRGGTATPTGSSQRGAFEDCEKLYLANGLTELAKECAGRADRMDSIR